MESIGSQYLERSRMTLVFRERGENYRHASFENLKHLFREVISLRASVNDGDTMQFDWKVITGEELDKFSLRVEVWESDVGYSEGDNDFLGYVQFTRDPVQSKKMIHDEMNGWNA
ncbi:MAG: hypothetical protein ACFFD4_08385 [Candidatus Odinarchaeota archaeon]